MHPLSSFLFLAGAVAAAASPKPAHPVCIVGAGPAGLRAARGLEDKGQKVVVFEKQPEVGGKSQAYYDKAHGTFHPLGALLLENKTYVEATQVIAQTNVRYLDTTSAPKWSYHWRSGEIGPYPTLNPEQGALLVAEIARYNVLWTTLFAPIGAVGYRSPIPAELSVTVAEWMAANDLHVLPVVFNLAMFVYGYGDLRETPVWYMLQFFTPSVVAAFSRTGAEQENLIDFHAVLSQYSKTIKGPIHTKATISRIHRSGTKTSVAYRVDGGHAATQQCSALILAFPPTVAALSAAGLDVSPAERELLSSVQLTNYFSGAVSMVVPETELWYANSSSPALPSEAAGQPVGFVRLFKKSDVATTWSWGAANATYTTAQARTLLIETLSRINKPEPANPASKAVPVTDADIHVFRKHDYFPHVSGADLASGWYLRFDKLQGQQKTYYASGLNGFELVEFALRAGKDVVDTYF